MWEFVKPIKLAEMGGGGVGGGQPSNCCLWTLQFPYIIPGLVSAGFTNLHISFDILLESTRFYTELIFLKGMFQKNGYPENFIDKCFKKLLNNIHLVQENVPTVKKSICS